MFPGAASSRTSGVEAYPVILCSLSMLPEFRYSRSDFT